MNKSLALKNKLSLYFLFLISFFILLYLLYFLINGERGAVSFYKIKNQNSVYKTVLKDLNSENNFLIDKITRLQSNTVDLDFLDEKIREKTGFVDNNELLILFD